MAGNPAHLDDDTVPNDLLASLEQSLYFPDPLLGLNQENQVKGCWSKMQISKGMMQCQENSKNGLNLNQSKQNETERLLLTPSKNNSFKMKDFSFKKENAKTLLTGHTDKTELGDFSGLYSRDFKGFSGSPGGNLSLTRLRRSPGLLLQSQSQQNPLLLLDSTSRVFPRQYSPKRKISSLSPFYNLHSSKNEIAGMSPFLNEKKKQLIFNTPKISDSPRNTAKLKQLRIQAFYKKDIKANFEKKNNFAVNKDSNILNKNYIIGRPLKLLETKLDSEPGPLPEPLMGKKSSTSKQSTMNSNIISFNTPNSYFNHQRKQSDSSNVFTQLADPKEDFATKEPRNLAVMNEHNVSFNFVQHEPLTPGPKDEDTKSKMNMQVLGQDSVNEFYQHDLSSLNKSDNNTILWKGEKERKGSHFSEFGQAATHSLFSQNPKVSKPKLRTEFDSMDEESKDNGHWERAFLKKRSRQDFDYTEKRRRKGKRRKICMREVNFMNVKKCPDINYFKKLTEKIINRRQKNSKRIFLKEQKTFFLQKSNYFRVFNPVLFDPVQQRSALSTSSLSLNKSKSRTIRDFFPALPMHSQGFDFMKKEIERTKKQQKEGKMSLNKFDFFKTNLKDEGKKSVSNWDCKGRSSVPKMVIPDLKKEALNLKKEHGDWVKKENLADNKILQEWDSINNATPNKNLDSDQLGKFPSQDMKLTPCKLNSVHSFLAYDTPVLHEEDSDKNYVQKARLSTLKKKIEQIQNSQQYLLKSPNMNNIEDILNNNNITLRKKSTKSQKQIPNETKKFYLRRETTTVILQGPLEESSLERSPKHRMKHLEKRRRRPDAEDVENTPKKCNCRLTECLKRYCSCFAGGKVCGPDCECQGCSNTEENPKRIAKMKKMRGKNSEQKEKSGIMGFKKKVGCKCSSSGCTKKYCECFRKGVFCMESCKCSNCRNARPLSPEL
jgi:hypothetical protein